MIKTIESSAMIPIGFALLSGCTHKDLQEDNGYIGRPLITVSYEWRAEETDLPDGMANLFYPSDYPSGHYWRCDFRPSGGTVRIPAATYDAMTFNNDTEDIIFSDIDNFSGLTFSTSPIDTGDIPADQLPFPPQRLFRQPDRMWADVKEANLITTSSMRDTVVFHPRRITRDYHIEMTGIVNLQSAIRYFAVVSDLSASFRPSAMRSEGPAVSMGGFMAPMDATTIASTVTSFGMANETSRPQLAVYMWLADGQRKMYHYDITDQILNAPDSMSVMIRVRGPELPEIKPGEDDNAGGGLDVGVDDWDIIDIEL